MNRKTLFTSIPANIVKACWSCDDFSLFFYESTMGFTGHFISSIWQFVFILFLAVLGCTDTLSLWTHTNNRTIDYLNLVCMYVVYSIFLMNLLSVSAHDFSGYSHWSMFYDKLCKYWVKRYRQSWRLSLHSLLFRKCLFAQNKLWQTFF